MNKETIFAGAATLFFGVGLVVVSNLETFDKATEDAREEVIFATGLGIYVASGFTAYYYKEGERRNPMT